MARDNIPKEIINVLIIFPVCCSVLENNVFKPYKIKENPPKINLKLSFFVVIDIIVNIITNIQKSVQFHLIKQNFRNFLK